MGIFDFFKKSKNIENYNGLNETYYNNGKGELKEKFTKKNGKKEGLYKTYYENGQLQSKYNFKNGKLDKLCKYWNDKGQLISEKNYKEGEKDGPHKSWFENGQLHIEVNYVNGNQEGLPKYYSENGQLKDKMFLDHIQKENKGKVKKNKAKLKFKVGDLIKKKKGGNFEYEIISIKPRFNAVEIYLDVTGKRIMQTFQHINKEWELAQPAIKLDPLEDKGDKKVDSEDVAVDLSGDQKMLYLVYPKLKGINFSTVKFGASGNSAKEFFASDIDGDWHYAQSQMIMLFKAFSKDKIESELKLLLNQNEINFDEKIEKTELLAEHWKGDGFKIEHPVMEGIDIIIITNEDMVPEDSLTLQKTDLASEVKLPTGYENIGIDHVYDGSKFLKANQGQLSLNIPLLFKDNDDSPHYILIGVTTLTLAKRIIDEIIEKNYGKQYFKELDEKDDWQYIYANKFFTIGFLSKYHCVRINMLHNLVDIGEN